MKQNADPALASLPLYPEYESGVATCYEAVATSHSGYVSDFRHLTYSVASLLCNTHTGNFARYNYRLYVTARDRVVGEGGCTGREINSRTCRERNEGKTKRCDKQTRAKEREQEDLASGPCPDRAKYHLRSLKSILILSSSLFTVPFSACFPSTL